ncbi:MAG: hypothetical protein M0R17_01480 [Candidatus Omnitrophica bacterium]|jgi:hypothetical protein|nr:hypothetical protein [Candidatus Omnitrophota bacterium]
MSKVIVLHKLFADTFPVTAATVTTGWLPGQGFQLNSTGDYASLASVDGTMFIGIDDDLEVSAPPTGSILTGIYGSGTKFLVDHSAEVAAGSATRCYASEVESASPNANLYVGSDAKWQTTSTGSVKGKLFQVPAASNNYAMGVILRF